MDESELSYKQNAHRQIFKIMSVTAVLANLTGCLSCLIFSGPAATETLITFGVSMIIFAMALTGWTTRYWDQCMWGILGLVSFIEFPFLLYVYGTAIVAYLVLGFVGAVVYIDDRRREVVASALILFDLAAVLTTHSFNVRGLQSNIAMAGAVVSSLMLALFSIYFLMVLWGRYVRHQEEELRELNVRLRKMAVSDALTGVYNRHYLTEYLEKEMNLKTSDFTIALLDLDDFKSVNDRFGHIYGDSVLVKFCEIVRQNVTDDDIIARFGGEEFIVLFRSLDEKEITARLGKIATQFRDFGISEKGENFTFSGGVVHFSGDDAISRIYKEVDRRLYAAKRAGKERIVIHDNADKDENSISEVDLHVDSPAHC